MYYSSPQSTNEGTEVSEKGKNLPAVTNNGLGRRLIFKLNSTINGVPFSKLCLSFGLRSLNEGGLPGNL